ncbi:hypothetical protein EZS27_016952 [termite gut metagenome]|uniref:YopX protein domain-containing protein n=1 Tax=termite gut metagenome TaxID=433724 RepID=A0A5J4RKX4_9ZZZZ
MNREAEFRGKNKGQWYFGSLVITDDNKNECFRSTPIIKKHQICFYHAGDWSMGQWMLIDVEPDTVGQFTGIKDINKKRIYEGDIFTLGDIKNKYVVEWTDCAFEGRQISKKSSVGIEYLQTRMEVIGNIHDNPVLIK